MTCLLDVNALIAALREEHPDFAKTTGWMRGKHPAVCPLSELGFLRVSTNKKALGTSMEDAEALLEKFYGETRPGFIIADIFGRLLRAKNSGAVTDVYLAKLAERHKLKLATLDTGIAHPAVEVIR